MSVKNKKKTEIFLNTQSIIKKFPNKILVVGNIHKNNVYSPSLNRAGLELACNNKHSKFKPITSTVLWGTKESSYLNTLGSEHEKINAIKRVLKLKPPLIILCNGFKLINLVEKIGKKFNSTIVVSELHSHQLYMTIAAWINEQLAQYTLIHGTLMFIDGTGVLIQGESGVGKSEVALQLIKHDSVFIGDDAILAANLGNKIFAKAADTAKTFLEVRGIGLINIARMFGVAKIKKNCLIDMIITLAKSNDLSRDYFERVGEKQSCVNLLGVEIPNYRIPVTYGRDISILVESAVNDFKLKQEGYNSAVEFMQNYKHVIKNK